MTRANGDLGAMAIVAENLSLWHAGRAAPSLANVSLSVPPGSLTVVAGRSGSGKSTLLRVLAGLIDSPSVDRVEGNVDLAGEPRSRGERLLATPIASRVALVSQACDDQICATTPRAEIAFGLENLKLEHAEIARRVEQAAIDVSLSESLDQPISNLSGGQRQRLVLAAMLVLGPSVLILDEPFSQLDLTGSDWLLGELARRRAAGMAVIVAEHRLDGLLAIADRLVVLDRGKVVGEADFDDTRAVAHALRLGGVRPPELVEIAARAEMTGVRSIDEFERKLTSPSAFIRRSSPSMARRGVETTTETLVAAKSLGFRYRHAAKNVFGSVKLEINAGDRIALVGPNGGGKSTLLAILAGVLRGTGGTLHFAAAVSRFGARGLVFQDSDLMLFSRDARRELSFAANCSGMKAPDVAPRVRSLADALGVAEFLDDPPQSLSQGQRLRVAVGAALSAAPRLLLLDEPTTGQDPANVDELLATIDRTLADARGALVFSTHDAHCVARHANRVWVLAEGNIAADREPKAFLADDALLALANMRRPALAELSRRLGPPAGALDAVEEPRQ